MKAIARSSRRKANLTFAAREGQTSPSQRFGSCLPALAARRPELKLCLIVDEVDLELEAASFGKGQMGCHFIFFVF